MFTEPLLSNDKGMHGQQDLLINFLLCFAYKESRRMKGMGTDTASARAQVKGRSRLLSSRPET
jgi:hypothetical protein